MEETRTEKISVNLTPSVLARLDDMRARRRWTRSTAAAVLIEHGLDSEDRMTALAGQATTSQEYTALTQAAAVAVLSIALAIALPHSFFDDYGWIAGPAAWALCALVTARVLSLPPG